MTNTVDSIWRKIDRRGENECWPWLGYRCTGKRTAKGTDGYGRVDILGREGVYVHRVAYLAANPGSITLDKKDGLLVLHTCDNTACCNPKHLYLGDHDSNMRDKVERGRSKYWGSSVNSPNAALTADDVRWIRFIHQSGRATIRAQALLYDVSKSVISHLLYGFSYQDID
jgi:hypothetical protein